MCKCPLFYGVTVIADGTFFPSNLLVLTLEMCSLLGNYSLLLGKIKSGQSCFSPLFKKSPIQEMSKFVNPRAGKSHPALPSGDSPSRCQRGCHGDANSNISDSDASCSHTIPASSSEWDVDSHPGAVLAFSALC